MTNLENVAKNIDSKSVEKIANQIGDSLEGIIARPSRTRWFLMGAAVGILGVIFLDPVEGPKRRKAVMSKARDLGTGFQKFGQEQWENFQEKASNFREKAPEADIPTRH